MLTAVGAGDILLLDVLLHFFIGPAVDRSLRSKSMLRHIVLDQLVRAPAGLAGLAVHQRIIEIADMSGRDPGLRVHQNGTVHADVIRIMADKGIPPCFLNIVLELYAERAVIPCIGQSAVDLGAGVHKTAGLRKSNDLVH